VSKVLDFSNELFKKSNNEDFFETDDLQIMLFRLQNKTHKHLYVHYTQLNPSLTEHFLKCCTTYCLRLKSLPHKPQQNCL